MAKNITEKIISSHLLSGNMKSGETIKIKIDQCLTQDATGTMCYLECESMGCERVKNELTVSYVDHNTIQVGFENADDHDYLRTIANKMGSIYSPSGNGICHTLQLERFSLPGKTLLGSDSHTPTSGGIGSLSIGAGGLDVALSITGEPYTMIYPRVVNIILEGKLKPYTSSKDVVLKVLEHFGVTGNQNTIFEYTGDGIKTLSVPERATICNMGAECGVTTSIFPSDEITKSFLKSQKREGFIPLSPDEGAKYDDVYKIDLSKIEPLVSCPHSPGNVKSIKEVEGTALNQVLIGSCTNSSIYDIHRVCAILKGKKVKKGVELGISIGSRSDEETLIEDGSINILLSSGARILESTCGFCIGNSLSPRSSGVSLRTNNRNFKGRCGTEDALCYLSSVETAASSAIEGVITSPEKYSTKLSKVKYSDSFIIDDSGFIYPTFTGDIIKGKNIKPIPDPIVFKDKIEGSVWLKLGDNITTDDISPAGKYLKYRSNIPEYSKACFANRDPSFYMRAMEKREKESGFIVSGLSYGQGSSREHAALCPLYLGVRCIIALSFERIHSSNLINFGIIPLTFENKEDYLLLDKDDVLIMENLDVSIPSGKVKLFNKSKNVYIKVKVNANEEEIKILLNGGKLRRKNV